jgi:hypothetical protein
LPTNIEVWAGYAKDQYDSAKKQVDRFRDWARQLNAAVAVVVGLELTLLVHILDLKPPFNHSLYTACTRIFLLAILWKGALLWWLFRVGYRGERIVGPESPVVLADFVINQNGEETQRMIGAYYAKAYERFYPLSERLARRVAIATELFGWSIFPSFLGVLLMVSLAASAQRPYNHQAMTEPSAPSTPSPSVPTTSPSPGTPVNQPPSGPPPATTPNPLLVTPTPGRPMTEGAKTPAEKR